MGARLRFWKWKWWREVCSEVRKPKTISYLEILKWSLSLMGSWQEGGRRHWNSQLRGFHCMDLNGLSSLWRADVVLGALYSLCCGKARRQDISWTLWSSQRIAIQNKIQLRDHALAFASYNKVLAFLLCSLAGLPPGAGVLCYPFPSKGAMVAGLEARSWQVGMYQAGWRDSSVSKTIFFPAPQKQPWPLLLYYNW